VVFGLSLLVGSTLLRLEFVVLVLYFSVYLYLCSFNYSLFFVVYCFSFFLFFRFRWVCLFWILGFVATVMIIFNLIAFFNFKVPLFLTPLCLFSVIWWLLCSLLFFISFVYLFFILFYFYFIFWGRGRLGVHFLAVI